MRAVDTNVLVRLLTPDHPEQTRAAEAFVAPGAWVPLLVLAETAWVLGSVYDFEAGKVACLVEMLLKHDRLTIQDPDAVSLALARFQAKPSLAFSDCLILEIARKAGHLPLGTFDRDLAKCDGAVRL